MAKVKGKWTRLGEGKTYYLYKDKFMSGWGKAEKGSYVISDKPLKRPEFKKIGESGSWLGFRFRSGKGKHFELWEGVTSPKGRPKEICELGIKKGGLTIKSCRKTGVK